MLALASALRDKKPKLFFVPLSFLIIMHWHLLGATYLDYPPGKDPHVIEAFHR
jgi:hypothetical protein